MPPRPSLPRLRWRVRRNPLCHLYLRAIPPPRCLLSRHRHLSTAPDQNARRELETVLCELGEHGSEYVSSPRLRLALQGLRQPPGKESIRVAVLGLADREGKGGGATAKRLLRLVLADPLKPSQEWEEQLAGSDGAEPAVLRLNPAQAKEEGGDWTVAESTNSLREIRASSPSLRDCNVELLVMEASLPLQTGGAVTYDEAEEAMLTPTVDVPSRAGQILSMPTSVHRALLVTNGFTGAAKIASLPALQNSGTVAAAVDMPNYQPGNADDTFKVVDLATASKALALIRQGPQNALEYERLWFQSNIPATIDWLKSSLAPASSSTSTQPAVRHLIASTLQRIRSQVQDDEARQMGTELSAKVSRENHGQGTSELSGALQEWAREAHEELQTELDRTFSGRKWRKLGWWKLFWRVDDVGILTSEVLGQGFLPEAEKKLVYLAGRVRQAKGGTSPDYYSQPNPPMPLSSAVSSLPVVNELGFQNEQAKWPTHIAFTRTYLSVETVSALQALAQRLLLEALGTSTMMTSFGGLLYASSYASTLYEAGAVAALGIVWSLRRLQKRWEAAREFWEGEVNEEGRKAVRAAERSMSEVLDETESAEKKNKNTKARSSNADIQRIKELVAQGEDALARLE